LPEQKLPGVKCQYLTVNVSAVLDVNLFWAQCVDDETAMHMNRINAELRRPLLVLPPTSIEVGALCVGPFLVRTCPQTSSASGDRLEHYRARITHRVDNVTVELFFLDWGNTEQVPIEQRESRRLDSAAMSRLVQFVRSTRR
jgi:hypothetical protein